MKPPSPLLKPVDRLALHPSSGDPGLRSVIEDEARELGLSFLDLEWRERLRLLDSPADADAADAADAAERFLFNHYTKEVVLNPGLVIVTTPASAYRVQARIGWLKHLRGPWWELVDSQVILRRNWSEVTGFAALAKGGLSKNHYLLDRSLKPTPILDLRILGVEYCDEEVWAKTGKMPNGGTLEQAFERPKGWEALVAA